MNKPPEVPQMQVAAMPLYLVHSWTGAYDSNGNPVMRQLGAFPSLRHAGDFVMTEKLRAFTVVVVLEIDREGIPLQPLHQGSKLILPANGEG